MKSWIIAACIVALALPLAVIGRGTFVHDVASLMFAIYIGAPALLVGFTTFMFRRRSEVAKRVAMIMGTIVFAAISSLLSLPIGAVIADHDVADAERYCESLIPQLESYKRAHGTYPRALAPSIHLDDEPRLLRRSLHYSSDGTTFSFSFDDSRGLLNFREFSSETRRWSDGD
jgi:hypothetical protein